MADSVAYDSLSRGSAIELARLRNLESSRQRWSPNMNGGQANTFLVKRGWLLRFLDEMKQAKQVVPIELLAPKQVAFDNKVTLVVDAEDEDVIIRKDCLEAAMVKLPEHVATRLRRIMASTTSFSAVIGTVDVDNLHFHADRVMQRLVFEEEEKLTQAELPQEDDDGAARRRFLIDSFHETVMAAITIQRAFRKFKSHCMQHGWPSELRPQQEHSEEFVSTGPGSYTAWRAAQWQATKAESDMISRRMQERQEAARPRPPRYVPLLQQHPAVQGDLPQPPSEEDHTAGEGQQTPGAPIDDSASQPSTSTSGCGKHGMCELSSMTACAVPTASARPQLGSFRGSVEGISFLSFRRQDSVSSLGAGSLPLPQLQGTKELARQTGQQQPPGSGKLLRSIPSMPGSSRQPWRLSASDTGKSSPPVCSPSFSPASSLTGRPRQARHLSMSGNDVLLGSSLLSTSSPPLTAPRTDRTRLMSDSGRGPASKLGMPLRPTKPAGLGHTMTDNGSLLRQSSPGLGLFASMRHSTVSKLDLNAVNGSALPYAPALSGSGAMVAGHDCEGRLLSSVHLPQGKLHRGRSLNSQSVRAISQVVAHLPVDRYAGQQQRMSGSGLGLLESMQQQQQQSSRMSGSGVGLLNYVPQQAAHMTRV